MYRAASQLLNHFVPGLKMPHLPPTTGELRAGSHKPWRGHLIRDRLIGSQIKCTNLRQRQIFALKLKAT